VSEARQPADLDDGTGAVVGITVMMFGVWKIVKRVKEQQAAREALAFQGNPAPYPIAPTEYSDGVDEALVMDDDLSTIETWRRGIPAYGDNESADLELITPSGKIALPLVQEMPAFHTAAITDPRAFGPSRWILGVRSPVDQTDELAQIRRSEPQNPTPGDP
jgi:hypothetical protein